MGTDALIISLISGTTLWGSDSSRHIFSQSDLFHQASGYIPIFGRMWDIPIFFAHYSEESLKASVNYGQISCHASFQSFKSLRVQLEMRRKQVEGSLQSTQRDGILTVDQALVKQAWERVSNRVRVATVDNHFVSHLFVMY